MNTTTRSHPRTLVQAFGPDARSACAIEGPSSGGATVLRGLLRLFGLLACSAAGAVLALSALAAHPASGARPPAAKAPAHGVKPLRRNPIRHAGGPAAARPTPKPTQPTQETLA